MLVESLFCLLLIAITKLSGLNVFIYILSVEDVGPLNVGPIIAFSPMSYTWLPTYAFSAHSHPQGVT